MRSDIRIFAVCVGLGFVGSFGGAHLLADLFATASREPLDTMLLLLLSVLGRFAA
jgi:hypothetical protein